MHLVPIITTEEVELALLTMRVAWQTDELKQLQQQLAPLEAAFAAFEQRVAMQSGGLTVERDRLRHICNELEHYTARLHARLAADPDGHLTAVFSPDELRTIGNLCGVDVSESWFQQPTGATTSGEGWHATNETWFGTTEPANPQPTPDEAEELRALYRQLARTFHPDLTENDGEREFRQEVMLRINNAWHMKDLVAMRAIGNDVRDLLSGKMLGALAYQLAWHRRELSQLEAKCEQVRSRITALRTSKTIALWHSPALTNAAIARHIARLRQEIEDLEERREAVLEEFRLALGSYASTR